VPLSIKEWVATAAQPRMGISIDRYQLRTMISPAAGTGTGTSWIAKSLACAAPDGRHDDPLAIDGGGDVKGSILSHHADARKHLHRVREMPPPDA
jgi:hypothetical protein